MTIQEGASTRRGFVRWVVVSLTLVIASIAYLDRTNIAIAAPLLKQDLSLSNMQLGAVFSAFVLGYAVAQPFAGRLADRYGSYQMISLGMLSWSLLTALTAMIPSTFHGTFAVLLAMRFLLGLGESVICPASNRPIANWIPSSDLGLANGLVFAGVGIGAGTAPPLITSIMLAHGWRSAFWVSALLGIAGLVAWLLVARNTPDQHHWLRGAELEYIADGRRARSTVSADIFSSWCTIIPNRQVWNLTLSYFCFGYVGYIFVTWLFTYISAVRGLDLKSSGRYGMLPFIAMAVASPLGGLISDRLAGRYGRRIGRCSVAAIGMAVAGVSVAAATRVQDMRLATLVLAMGAGSLYLAQSGFWTLSIELGRGYYEHGRSVRRRGCCIANIVSRCAS